MPNNTNRTQLLEEINLVIKNAGYEAPTPLQEKAIPLILKGKNLFIHAGKAEGKTATILIPLLISHAKEKKKPHTLILVNEAKLLRKIFRQFKRFSTRMTRPPQPVTLGSQDNIQKELQLLKRNPGIIIGTSQRLIDHIRRENVHVKTVKTLFLDLPEFDENQSFLQDVKFILSKLSSRVQVVVLSPNPAVTVDLSGVLQRFQVVDQREETDATKQESVPMSSTKTIPEMPDDSLLNEKIEEILRYLKNEEDPGLLNTYRRLIRKKVPLNMRGYFSAALLKMALSGGNPFGTMKTLFVSVGKNRRVFPRDLARYFAAALNISPADIGNVKVLDNYSFIDVPSSLAAKAIEELNNREFRGKPISVNYAKKKD